MFWIGDIQETVTCKHLVRETNVDWRRCLGLITNYEVTEKNLREKRFLERILMNTIQEVITEKEENSNKNNES